MKRIQRIIVIIYCIAIAFACFYVPWKEEVSLGAAGQRLIKLGYSLIWSPLERPPYVSIDYARILLEILGITALGAMTFTLAGGFKKKNKKLMDNQLLKLFIEEIGRQCSFALIAYNNIHNALQIRDKTEPLFFFVHAFLSHAALVSKLLWPSKPTLIIARGKLLRKELKVRNGRQVKRLKFRNHLEHYDDRLEEWALESKSRNIVDMNIMPRTAITGLEKKAFHRNLDPTGKEFYFRDEDYNLSCVARELKNIEIAAQNWLNNYYRNKITQKRMTRSKQ